MVLVNLAQKAFRIPCRCLVGRSPLADLRLVTRRGSSEHATLGWYSGRWILRDLGSSNGTKVNGKVLFPGDRIQVAVGSRIQFGDDDEVWTMVDGDAPDPCAVLLGPQQVQWGSRGLLILPNPDLPEASAFADASSWRVDLGGEVRAVECGEVVSLPSGYWRLLVPEFAGSPRALTAGPELDLNEASLQFSVAPERISLTLRQGTTVVTIPSRACLNTLVALARIRLRSTGPEDERGWISSLDVGDMLHYTPEKVNVDVHRLRKLFQEAGVRNAFQIVERDDAKRLRIGVRQLAEEPAPDGALHHARDQL
jgi:hypothetical protein